MRHIELLLSVFTTALISASACGGGVTTTGAGGTGGQGTGGAEPTCTDGRQNGAETDKDCGGGACPPCALGEGCVAPSDCESGFCVGGLCAEPEPTCTDAVKNGDETDIDCGGASCPPCGDGKDCVVSADCASDVCELGLCQIPACDDMVKNGNEANVDCGGSCAPCPDGSPCSSPADCTSGVCELGLCQVPACDDMVMNGDETGTDCGGSCAPCPDGSPCSSPADCTSGVCELGLCQIPACDDMVKNGNEANVDCGGSCAPCPDGSPCSSPQDCTSGVCELGICQIPTCDDMVMNGSETGVDCGGPACPGCPDGDPCLVDSDCLDGVCDAGVCRPGLGCATGARRGFHDETIWPNIAACGTPVIYSTAVANAATVCDAGFHMCSAAEVNAVVSITPTFDPPGSGWVGYTDPTTNNWGQHTDLTCTALQVVSNLQGTGACTAGGSFPEGWRLYAGASSWGGSHQTAAGCIAHTAHACGFPGGVVSAVQLYTLCCQ